MNFKMNFNWTNPKLVVANCEVGKGQFAAQAIACGELLAAFGGRVMTRDDFDRLPPEIQHYPYQISENPELLFGPMQRADMSDGDYFNHSCNPNAGFRGALHLVALRAIAVGEQVTFDYATCMTGDFGNMPCSCGEPDCRRFISGDDWKIPSLQQKYAGYWQPYIEEKILAWRLARNARSMERRSGDRRVAPRGAALPPGITTDRRSHSISGRRLEDRNAPTAYSAA
jgi:hypothetical protein